MAKIYTLLRIRKAGKKNKVQINPVSLGHKVIEHMHGRITKETCKILDKTLAEKDWNAGTNHRYLFICLKNTTSTRDRRTI